MSTSTALRSSSASAFERLVKSLTEHIDRLIRHYRVFLGALVEMENTMRKVAATGAASWNSRVEGAVRAYLFGVSWIDQRVM